MKFLKPRTFVIFALAGLSGTVLLHTSQNVQQAEERLEALERSKYHEEEKIRMLRAEWETLNRPERLERLAREFLDLVPPAPDQMGGQAEALPVTAPVEFEVDERAVQEAQPVSFEAPKTPAPKPAVKPTIKTQNEKSFGDLLDELGGAP